MNIKKTTNRSKILLTGKITDSRELNQKSSNPVAVSAALPTVFGEVPNAIWSEPDQVLISIGHGALQSSEQVLLSFWMQAGPTMCYWLADPNDFESLNLLKTWANAKHMSVALKARDRLVILTPPYPEIPDPVRAFCESGVEMDTERFLRSAEEMVAFLQSTAKSEIPSIKKVKNVHTFFLLGVTAGAAITSKAH